MIKMSRTFLAALVGAAGFSAAMVMISATAATAATDSGKPSALTDSAPATTQPARAVRTPSGGRPMPVPLDPRLPPWRFVPTNDQIKDMEEFVEKHSPRRFKAYQNFNPPSLGGPFGSGHDRLQRSMVRGFLELQVLASDDPDLYNVKLHEMKLQDDIFGIVADARERGRDADLRQVRADLRLKETELREVRKQQAIMRVQRLSEALEHQKQLVNSLSGDGTADIDKAVHDELSFGGRILWGNPWGGGPGPGGGGPGRGFGVRGGERGGPATEPSRREQ